MGGSPLGRARSVPDEERRWVDGIPTAGAGRKLHMSALRMQIASRPHREARAWGGFRKGFAKGDIRVGDTLTRGTCEFHRPLAMTNTAHTADASSTSMAAAPATRSVIVARGRMADEDLGNTSAP